MRKISFFILLSFVITSETFAQKRMKSSWNSNTIEALEIISDDVFKITVVAGDVEKVNLYTLIEGENNEHVLLKSRIEDGILQITTGFTPFFEPINDKLAAHKVLAIEMKLIVPRNMNILIESQNSSVEIVEILGKIDINLREGNCSLLDIRTAQINTVNGSIKVRTTEDVKAIAESKNGKVKNELLNTGKYLIKAQSVNGDITLENYP